VALARFELDREHPAVPELAVRGRLMSPLKADRKPARSHVEPMSSEEPLSVVRRHCTTPVLTSVTASPAA